MSKRNRGALALQSEAQKVIRRLRAQAPEVAEKLTKLQYDWFRIRNSTEDDEEVADLYIYDEIVPQYMAEWFGGVSAEGLIAQLNELTASTINVRINSPGGAVFEAIAIYNALVSHSATINVYVDSLAASAASVIAMAGDKITMMVGSRMMIHDALGVEMGNAAELREFADFLDRQSDNIASIYANKTGGTPEDMRALMLAETWLFAEEAVELGLADSVYEKKSKNAEEEDPEEGDDDSEEGVPNEEPPGEEEADPEEESEEEEDPDKEAENLLKRKHAIANRGFKYAGRRKAPAPLDSIESDVDDIFAALMRK